jgi:uncharacterized protein YbjT (DUF2867 family)
MAFADKGQMPYPMLAETKTVLVCGASGFLGSHIVRTLELRGHRVLRGLRQTPPSGSEDPLRPSLLIDFEQDQTPAAWHERLKGIDVVVNAVGILRETGSQRFESLHVDGPVALFEACVDAGVDRVIQISALGADQQGSTSYHQSKHRADEALLGLPLNSVVLQPSLVFGAQGASSRLFAALATLPVTPLPADGEQLVQPVHVDDLSLAVALLVEGRGPARRRLAVAGAQAISLRDYLGALREGLGLNPAPVLQTPRWLVERLARWGNRRPQALLDMDSWRMLERGNTSGDTGLSELLGRPARPIAQFIEAGERSLVRQAGLLLWWLPLLRTSLALVWLSAGLLSLGIFPVNESLAMLSRLGVGPALAVLLLYGAAGLNLLLGLATLVWPGRRLWLAQALLVLLYTAIISVFLPEQWLHPFGPVVKNLPILALLGLLWAFEERA